MRSFIDSNREYYATTDAIELYSRYNKLQPPEGHILGILKQRLGSMAALDLGIGGGRTTALLAHQVKTYVGIDYSQGMVDVAKDRFANCSPALDLRWGDAACLSAFDDHMFDFVLFSFNGIDCLPESRRQDALDEIFRVLTPGGVLCFSSHNIQNIPTLLRFKWHRHPNVLIRRIIKYFKLRWINRVALQRLQSDQLTVRDGSSNFNAAYVYVRPSAMVNRMLEMGLRSVRCFALADGHEIPHDELDAETGAWVYYLCEK